MEVLRRYCGTEGSCEGPASRGHRIDGAAALAQAKTPPRRVHDEAQAAALCRAGPAVLFIDLDGFKDVNDSLGYKAGDLVLVAAATAVTQPSRGRTCSGGTAGDEFLVVITNVGHGTARAIAQRAAEGGMDSLHSPFDLPGHEVRVGASIGVAVFPSTAGPPPRWCTRRTTRCSPRRTPAGEKPPTPRPSPHRPSHTLVPKGRL